MTYIMCSNSLCSFEICRILKEENIDISCEYYYYYDGNGEPVLRRFNEESLFLYSGCSHDYIYFCPFLDDLLNWFIENRSVTLSITMGIYAWNGEDRCRLHWDYHVVELSDERLEYPFDAHYGYNSYREALHVGLYDLVNVYLKKKNG